MGKGKKGSLPPSPEAREKLLQAARDGSEPTAAAAIAKKVLPPDRVNEAIATPWLEEAVQAGQLFAYPPKTPAGKPRFWGREVSALIRSAIEESVPTLREPLTVKDLIKQLKLPLKVTPAEVQPVVEELVRAGRVFEIPAATAKAGTRYWNRDLVAYGRQVLSGLARSKGPQAETALKKGLKGYDPRQVEAVWSAATREHDLCSHPPFGKVKKELFGQHPPSPQPYLKEIGAQLSKVVAVLRGANVPVEDVRRALVEIAEAAGVTFGGMNSVRHADPASTSRPVASSEVTHVDLVAIMRKIEPGADRGALVGAGRLRRASGMEKQLFDTAVIDLARRQRVVLHRHDFPASLTTEARDELIFDGIETYYIGVALRNEG